MQAENASQVFGLNWLQDIEPIEVTGVYDPQQELWTSTDSVKASIPQYTSTTTSAATRSIILTLTDPGLDSDTVPDFDSSLDTDDDTGFTTGTGEFQE